VIETHVAAGPPIRVAFVLHSMGVAGAETLVAETIRRLGDRIEPIVFCLDAVGALGEQFRNGGVEVLCFARRPGRDFRVAHHMARAARARRIELLHAHQYTPFFYAALSRLLLRNAPKLIFTEHGRHYPDVVSFTRRAANRLVLARLAHDVNAVCGFSARALQTVDGFSVHPVHVIENGVDLDRYGGGLDKAEAKGRLGLAPTRRYVGNIARFHPVKDHATLLRAFARVVDARDDVDLLLVGDGELRRALEQQTRSLGIVGRVRFMGIRPDVPDILRALDIFALTSCSEAASITLLEAMASALPVVVTDVGGNPEMVRHTVEGLLVARGDADGIAAAILHLRANPGTAKALGDAGAARVRAQYRLETTIERYYALYHRLARPTN
jgi:glycosyltransferase involved in cell wall biosynthesis